jgi:hypothetical protein
VISKDLNSFDLNSVVMMSDCAVWAEGEVAVLREVRCGGTTGKGGAPRCVLGEEGGFRLP